jgi:hypothetical protein
MGLTDRLSNATRGGHPPETATGSGSLIGATVRRRKDAIADSSRRLKVKVHNKLFETIDVSKLETLEPAMVSIKVTAAINDILNEDGRLLTDIDRGRLIEELKNELLGLGPLEPLLRDDEITDILVQRPRPGLRRKARQVARHRRRLPGRPASDADHRSDRVSRRTAR